MFSLEDFGVSRLLGLGSQVEVQVIKLSSYQVKKLLNFVAGSFVRAWFCSDVPSYLQ